MLNKGSQQSSAVLDVLIVGSGPTGLMAALLLQHCGVKCRILDKSNQQAHESRAFLLQARSMELLQNLGIVDKFIERGVIAPGIQLFINGNQAAEMNLNDIGTEASPYAFILMLPQSEIEKLLSEELESRGIQIEYEKEVLHFTQTEKTVLVSAVNSEGEEEQINASYLIGADGAHSVVRKILGLNFEGEAYPQDFMLADCSIDWPLEYSFGKIFMSGTSLGIYLPLRGKDLGRVIAVNPKLPQNESREEGEATTAETLTLKELEKAFQKAVGLPLKLSKPEWLTRYRIHHRGVDQYGEGSVFVAGDAAHIHSPAGGQGMNTGLQDAANLAWKLAVIIKGKGPKELLETYNDERWPVGQKLLHFTDKLFAKFTSTKHWTLELRNIFVPLFLKLITKIKPCRFRFFRFISELGIRYHENPFLLDDILPGPHDFPRWCEPGCRAPNGLIKRNYDVFSLLQGYQFHVLALSRKALSPEEIDLISTDLAKLPKSLGLPLQVHFITHSLTGANPKIIQAESNQIFERYGLNAHSPYGLFLVRPDGYLAYRSDELKIESLVKFCALFSGSDKVSKLKVNS